MQDIVASKEISYAPDIKESVPDEAQDYLYPAIDAIGVEAETEAEFTRCLTPCLITMQRFQILGWLNLDHQGKIRTSTRIMGTHGFAAPEYIATGHLYVKSDVYGFGVVLLEILTGLRAHDSKRPSGQQNLVDWIKPLAHHRTELVNWVLTGPIAMQYLQIVTWTRTNVDIYKLYCEHITVIVLILSSYHK